MELELKGQVAFVAGSSRGIGKAIARALLAEGARVVVTGRDQGVLEQVAAEFRGEFGADRVLSVPGDLTDADTAAFALEQTVARFGALDHLVANLGTGSGPAGWDIPEADWERLFAMNFFAAVRLTQAALPHLLGREGGGSIVYISSITGVEATPAPLPYSAAKAALVNYAKNLARQLGGKGVRVNTIAPGNIFFAGGSWERHLAARREAVETMLRTEVPQGRFGTPEEIAALAVFLCSPRAGFATGGCFVVDGGQTRSV